MVCIPKILLDVPPTSVPADPELRCISTPSVQCIRISHYQDLSNSYVSVCYLYAIHSSLLLRSSGCFWQRIELPDADRREFYCVCILANAQDHYLTVTDSAPLRRFRRYPTLFTTENGSLMGPHAGRSRL